MRRGYTWRDMFGTAVLTLLLLVTSCSSPKQRSAQEQSAARTSRDREASAEASPSGPDTEIDAGIQNIRTVSIQTPPSEMPDGAVLMLNATLVEADTVRVGELYAILVEAQEIRSRDKKTVSGYPTIKEPNLSQLEGQLVEGDSLQTHHVRARLVIADRLRAHTIRKLKGPLKLPDAGAGAPIRNGCRTIVQGTTWAECGQWIQMP
jgi:hypothetical protein